MTHGPQIQEQAVGEQRLTRAGLRAGTGLAALVDIW